MLVRRPLRAAQRGLSIVEMMVGIAVGLIVVAAATLMVAGQLADNRRLLLETQVQQDLRASADLITRELRRAGFWKDADRSTGAAGETAARLANPYATAASAALPFTETVAQEVTFSYAAKDPPDDNVVGDAERRGFRLRDGIIETQLGAGNWQPLTDPGVMKVTRFEITTRVQPVVLECAVACPATTPDCQPRLLVTDHTVLIEGEATFDPEVRRTARSTVRVRNDTVVGECPA